MQNQSDDARHPTANQGKSMEENSHLHQRSRADGMLDGYLAALATSLAAVESGFGEEARRHILESAAAHEELGHDPVAAMRSAIEQFGRPREIAHAMADPTPALNGVVIPPAALALAWGSVVGGALVLTAFNWMYWLGDGSPPELYFAFNGLVPAMIAVLLATKSKLSPIVAGLWTGFTFGAGMLLVGAIMMNRPPYWNSTINAFAILFFVVGCMTYAAVAWFLRWFRDGRRLSTRGARLQRLTD
jgi:hypothetical protein